MAGTFVMSIELSPSSTGTPGGAASQSLVPIKRIGRLVDSHEISAQWFVPGVTEAGSIENSGGNAREIRAFLDAMNTPQIVIDSNGPDLTGKVGHGVPHPEEIELGSERRGAPVWLSLPTPGLHGRMVPGWLRMLQFRHGIARADRGASVLHVVLSLWALQETDATYRLVEDMLFHVAEARAANRLSVMSPAARLKEHPAPPLDSRPALAS